LRAALRPRLGAPGRAARAGHHPAARAGSDRTAAVRVRRARRRRSACARAPPRARHLVAGEQGSRRHARIRRRADAARQRARRAGHHRDARHDRSRPPGYAPRSGCARQFRSRCWGGGMARERLSALPGAEFDGRNRPYVPGLELRIAPSLRLHRECAAEVDPVTYEVVRHALWNVNEEHGATIQRLSGSPVAMYALDLNPSILTEDAEFVFFGPYMQYMSGVTDTQVKWTLEHRSDNP